MKTLFKYLAVTLLSFNIAASMSAAEVSYAGFIPAEIKIVLGKIINNTATDKKIIIDGKGYDVPVGGTGISINKKISPDEFLPIYQKSTGEDLGSLAIFRRSGEVIVYLSDSGKYNEQGEYKPGNLIDTFKEKIPYKILKKHKELGFTINIIIGPRKNLKPLSGTQIDIIPSLR